MAENAGSMAEILEAWQSILGHLPDMTGKETGGPGPFRIRTGRSRVFQDTDRQDPGLSGHGQAERGLSGYGQAGAGHFRTLTRCAGYSGT